MHFLRLLNEPVNEPAHAPPLATPLTVDVLPSHPVVQWSLGRRRKRPLAGQGTHSHAPRPPSSYGRRRGR